jgi:hypothetical protein
MKRIQIGRVFTTKCWLLRTKEFVEEYILLAKDVSGEKLIEKLKHTLTPKSVLLEIGSGLGTDWNILNESYEVVGSDYSPEFLYCLRNEYPEGTFIAMKMVSKIYLKIILIFFLSKIIMNLKIMILFC